MSKKRFEKKRKGRREKKRKRNEKRGRKEKALGEARPGRDLQEIKTNELNRFFYFVLCD